VSKGGGQGAFAQMQEPGLGMDIGGFGGGGPQPFTGYTPPETQPIQMEEPVPLGIADNLDTGFIPNIAENASGFGRTVIDGEGLLSQLQPINQPISSPQPQPRLGIGDPSNPMLQELRPLPQPGGFGGAMRRFNNLSAGDRERLGDLRVGDIFGFGRQTTPEIRRINHVNKGPEDLARVNAGLGSKGGRSSPYQTDGIVPPPAPPQPDIGPIEQPVPFKSGPVEPRVKPLPMPPKFQPMPIDRLFPQPMPPRQAPIFAPPRTFPFPMPPRIPPMPPRMPGRNRQFQMPFFGSSYGRMNPYAGQFSGYGVPSNMFSFAQPHYQPYVPPPPPPPVMQLPPNQGGGQVFSGGFGGQGIGGFGRYNLGLANRQFGGR
jgi:hypothetical protein